MNTFASALLALAVIATPAAAEITVPSQFQGEWCDTNEDDTHGHYWDKSKCEDESKMRIERRRIVWWEQDCNITKVKIDPQQVLHLDMKCGAEGSVWPEKVELSLVRAFLVYRTTWRGKERVER
jgi:hypothetical protein